MNKKGSLVSVGLGMTLGAHITPISRSIIENADVVFVAASNNLVEEWVKGMNNDVRSLQPYYDEGTSRRVTYNKWIDLIMGEVRAGKNVCGAYYGHPGVFAWAPHETIKIAKEEGFLAYMEPGISAEDCLFADLGINPGTKGCINLEATQFMMKHKSIDPTSYLILWQVAIAGDISLAKFSTNSKYKQVLLDKLYESYPKNHEIILYECAVLPIDQPRIEKIELSDINNVEMSLKTTVVIPPSHSSEVDKKRLKIIQNL